MTRNRNERKWLRQLAVLALAGCMVGGASGCIAAMAGAAAGGAGYAYYRGNVSETYDGDFAALWQASHDSLIDMALPVVTETKDGMKGTIETRNGKDERVVIYVEQQRAKVPTDPPRTDVGVRVATFGDQELSRRVHQQIVLRLSGARGGLPPSAAHVPAAPPGPVDQSGWRTATR